VGVTGRLLAVGEKIRVFFLLVGPYSFPGGTGGKTKQNKTKNPPANARDVRGSGSIPGLERYPGEGHGNPLQYFCLKNPRDRESWQATVHRVAQSWT